MSKVLVILEPAEQGFGSVNTRVLGAVAALRQYTEVECDLLLCDTNPDRQHFAAAVPDVSKVIFPDVLPDTLAETLAPWLAGIATAYDYLFIASTTFGKDLLPRLGALLDAQPIADVIGIDGPNHFRRPVYAGAAVVLLSTNQPQKLLGIRTSAFDAIKPVGGNAQPVCIPGPANQSMSRVVSEEPVRSERPELRAARVVVSGGRGMQSRENFELLYQLADKLGGAVGASRAAVDAGFVTNDMQVGQTGKVVAPELYIAVGISGAVQHLAGMSESRVVVAINKDPEAPIFEVADYGLVADLFEAVPTLIAQL